MRKLEHIAGHTTHARRGAIKNVFRYGVDFILIDPSDEACATPMLFSRNRFNLAALYDRDHGGPLKNGTGLIWARAHFAEAGVIYTHIELLTQPRFMGYGFNPVSFWFAWQGTNLMGVIAEVSTPFADRHSYLCVNTDLRPIARTDQITTPKMLHVSPFQQVEGHYAFNFDITADKIAIRIFHGNGDQGVIATLYGPRAPMTNLSLIRAYIRRPFGALRTLVLIHWQALVLKAKGVAYHRRPSPPSQDLTKPGAPK
jgi:DUF1365 family protein